MANELTQTALAAALGLDKSRVSQLKAAGMPVDSVAAAQAWREANQNVAQRKQAPPGLSVPVMLPAPVLASIQGDTEEDFQAARTRREIAEANLAEMREAELQGELIRVDAVRAAWSRGLAQTREALLQIPARAAPALLNQTDLDRIGQILDAELRAALAELSGGGGI